MKKSLFLTAAFLVALVDAVAQNYVVEVTSTGGAIYASSGGQLTFRVTLTYPTDVSAVSFTAKPPGTAWAHVSTAGTNVPGVKPNPGDQTDPLDPQSAFGWTYPDFPPPSPASFTFVLSYPSGMTGPQTIKLGGDYRLAGVRTPVTIPDLIINPEGRVVITSHPQSQTASVGDNVTLAVTATGSGTLTYQWQKGGVNIGSATSSTYAIVSAQLGDAGDYSVVVTNGGGSTTSNVATLTVNPLVPTAPSFTTHPANAQVVAGQSATFAVAVTGTPAPSIRWQRSTDGGSTWSDLVNGSGISGADTTILTVSSVTSAMNNHRFQATATNGVPPAAVSNAATLTVHSAPVIATQPRSQSVGAGGTLTLTVVANGNPAPSYQWKKGGVDLVNGGRVSGATTATLTITGFEAGDVGNYTVVASNGVGSPAVSSAAAVQLTPSGLGATHAVMGGGYVPGGNVTITNTMTYSLELSSLSWSVLLPAGWSFVSAVNAGTPATQPNAGDISVLDWTWSSFPVSPATFTYTVKAPASASGNYAFAALVEFGIGEAKHQLMAQTDPLTVGPVLYHNADTNQNWKIDVSELTRIIALYNTRYTTPDGKVRTGAYKEAPAGTTTVDGFASDPAREPTGSHTLTRFHTADYNQNGKIDVSELTRVIALYNTRFTTPEGKIRTGYYKPAGGTTTVDGFTTDAARDPNAP